MGSVVLVSGCVSEGAKQYNGLRGEVVSEGEGRAGDRMGVKLLEGPFRGKMLSCLSKNLEVVEVRKEGEVEVGGEEKEEVIACEKSDGNEENSREEVPSNEMIEKDELEQERKEEVGSTSDNFSSESLPYPQAHEGHKRIESDSEKNISSSKIENENENANTLETYENMEAGLSKEVRAEDNTIENDIDIIQQEEEDSLPSLSALSSNLDNLVQKISSLPNSLSGGLQEFENEEVERLRKKGFDSLHGDQFCAVEDNLRRMRLATTSSESQGTNDEDTNSQGGNDFTIGDTINVTPKYSSNYPEPIPRPYVIPESENSNESVDKGDKSFWSGLFSCASEQPESKNFGSEFH